MSITQGSPLPNITETKTTTQNAPGYYTDLVSGLSAAGTTALNKTPEQLVAAQDPLQTQAYNLTPEKAASYIPGITAAANTANTAAQGITPDMIQQFMNPYTGNVVDELRRQSDINFQRNVMPGLKAGFVGGGGFGGRGYAGALGQAAATANADLIGAESKALQTGYGSALDAALRNAGLLNETAKTQADIASQTQGLGLKETGALTAAGAGQQAYQQSLLDAPLKTAANVAPLLEKYKVPTGTTETFVGPKAGSYDKSPLEKITGLATFLGAAQTGTAGERLKSLYTTLRSTFGGDSTKPIDLGGGLQVASDGSLIGYRKDGTRMSEDEALNALNGGDALADVYGPNGGLPTTDPDANSVDNNSNTTTTSDNTDNTDNGEAP
jgi:hypothetical protein